MSLPECPRTGKLAEDSGDTQARAKLGSGLVWAAGMPQQQREISSEMAFKVAERSLTLALPARFTESGGAPLVRVRVGAGGGWPGLGLARWAERVPQLHLRSEAVARSRRGARSDAEAANGRGQAEEVAAAAAAGVVVFGLEWG